MMPKTELEAVEEHYEAKLAEARAERDTEQGFRRIGEAKLAEANRRIAELEAESSLLKATEHRNLELEAQGREIEATVADMRSVIDLFFIFQSQITMPSHVHDEVQRILKGKAGQGWLSPEKAGELRALLARLRNILRPGDYIESQWREVIDKVLEQ